nr:hypothetical protein [Tanacetum cinerariifolium]
MGVWLKAKRMIKLVKLLIDQLENDLNMSNKLRKKFGKVLDSLSWVLGRFGDVSKRDSKSNFDVAAIFEVLLTTVGDLEVLIKDIDAGKHEALLCGMTNEKRKVVIDALGAMWVTLLNMQKSALIIDDSMSGKASPSVPIVQSVDINTRSTSYVGAAGGSAKD